MALDDEFEPLRPDDSISCVGVRGFKSRPRDSTLRDEHYRASRSRVRAQAPLPLQVVEPYTKPSSSKRAPQSRSKPSTIITTTTTLAYRPREPSAAAAPRSRYAPEGLGATTPLRSPPRYQQSTADRHTREPSWEPRYPPSSTRSSSSRQAPPRSNDRYYESRRLEPVEDRGRRLLDPSRSQYFAPRTYSQDRASRGGTYGAFVSPRTVSTDRARESEYGRSNREYEMRYGSGKLPRAGSISYRSVPGFDDYESGTRELRGSRRDKGRR